MRFWWLIDRVCKHKFPIHGSPSAQNFVNYYSKSNLLNTILICNKHLFIQKMNQILLRRMFCEGFTLQTSAQEDYHVMRYPGHYSNHYEICCKQFQTKNLYYHLRYGLKIIQNIILVWAHFMLSLLSLSNFKWLSSLLASQLDDFFDIHKYTQLQHKLIS